MASARYKEMYLDNFASKFTAAGLVVVVFAYRFFSASAGEAREQLLTPEPVMDYRDAISWVSLQPEVDSQCIDVWGTLYNHGNLSPIP